MIGLLFAPGINANPIFSLAVIGVSAGLILVDFNYVKKHADEDDVVWLATGIFIAIVNIFLSLLNLLSDR
jgi:modulator of FtsH protease